MVRTVGSDNITEKITVYSIGPRVIIPNHPYPEYDVDVVIRLTEGTANMTVGNYMTMRAPAENVSVRICDNEVTVSIESTDEIVPLYATCIHAFSVTIVDTCGDDVARERLGKKYLTPLTLYVGDN